MTDLHDLLDQATDRVEAAGLSNGVLAEAHRRRVRQRGVTAGAIAAVAVVAVVIAGNTIGGGRATRELPPATQSTTESTTVPIGQARWDPREVESLSVASDQVAPLLPDTLDVPDLAPHVEDDPVDAAVLSVDDGADVLLLGTDGRWRCVVVPGKAGPAPFLSADGTRLAVPVADGVVTVDLTTGERSRRPLPSSAASWPSPPVVAAARGWSVVPVAGLAGGSVLLRVEPPGGTDRQGWWLVQWDPATNDFALVSSTDSDPDKTASFATDLLGRS